MSNNNETSRDAAQVAPWWETDDWKVHIEDEIRSNKMATYTNGKEVRMIFKCKSCKHVWAHMYITRVTAHLASFYREVEGKEVESFDDQKTCPQCHAWKGITSSVVQGVYKPERKCDASCRSATGKICNCSCAGKHHGERWLEQKL